MTRILLFIPMYNCQNQIARVLDQLDERFLPYISQVIVVNNRSTDDGERVVCDYLASGKLKIPASLLRNDENYGLGGSHKVAFQYAVTHGFESVIVLHGDDQGHIEDMLPHLVSGAYNGCDALLGARFMKGSRLEGYSAFRTFGNRVYNLLFSLATGMRIHDLGSGLNLYHTEMLKNGFYDRFPDNLMFNYCMILAAAYNRQNIRFFPIRWSEDDQVSNVRMFRQAVTVLGYLMNYVFCRHKLMRAELRDAPRSAYTASVVYQADASKGGVTSA